MGGFVGVLRLRRPRCSACGRTVAQPDREIAALLGCSQALLVLEIAIVLGALGFPFDLGDPLIIEGGVKVIGAAFIFVPGQLGASESIYTLLAVAVGFLAATGLTIALVRRIRALIVATIGLAALVTTVHRSGRCFAFSRP